MAESLPRYDRRQTYQWNYEQPPPPVEIEIPPMAGEWSFCGRRVSSPLGIAAGPLLNGGWCLYYASLGFDVVTYKTVRGVERECYAPPNLQPVSCADLHGGESRLPASETMQGSWAVSFGMPSKSPDVWRADIEQTRKQLPGEKLLSVSVVGTVQPGWGLEDLAQDYARCAKWALDAGADCIETNFSCPNVATCDGQLYQQPEAARVVAQCVRQSIGQTPYLAKIGHVASADEARPFLESVQEYVDALATTNSVAATVADSQGNLMFERQKRGICGAATLEASLAQVAMFARHIQDMQADVTLIGVGGVGAWAHAARYLAAGAEAVHLASAAMVNPLVGIEIRRDFSASAV